MALPYPNGGDWVRWARSLVVALTAELNRLKPQAQTAMPVGTIVDWAGSGDAPEGWLKTAGNLLAASSYPSLYAVIGTTFNVGGDPPGFYRLPNLTGKLIKT